MKNFTHRMLQKFFLAFVVVACLATTANAQQKKLTLTGYNVDVIADPVLNGTADSLTNIGIDGTVGSAFFTQGFSNDSIPFAGGLPANGIILSPSGHYYQLQPASSLNALEVDFDRLDTATFTLAPADQAAYDTLFVLATAGFGVTFADVFVNFTDSTSTNYGYAIPDWTSCTGCTNYGITNLGSVSRSTSTLSDSMLTIYEQPIALSNTDKVKIVKSITFDVPEEVPGHVNVFAITGTSASILPVSLVSFGAAVRNGQALLQWKTSAEQNNTQFIIERATAAYPNVFEKVGTVRASSSLTGSSYSFANSPGLSGTYLYRLSQQDADGNTKILGVRSVTFNGKVNWLVQDLGLQWRLVTSDAYKYRLTDINGRILQEASGSGTTTISKPEARGIYILQVWQGGQSGTKKLIH